MDQHDAPSRWSVEELGRAHAVVSSPGAPEAFVVPRAALPDGIREGDRLGISTLDSRPPPQREPPVESGTRDSAPDEIFAEALQNLSRVQREGPGNFLKQG